MEEKTTEFRIITQNVGTLGLSNDLYKVYTHRSELKELDADIFLFNETNTTAHIPEVVRKI